MRAVRQIFYTFIVLVFLPLVAVAVVVTTWLADRDKPVSVIKVWTEPDTVAPCGTVDLWVDRYAERSTGLELEYFFTDSKRQSAPPVIYSTKTLRGPLGRFSYSVSLSVPCTFDPGWAVMERRVSYWRNPVHKYLWPIDGTSRKVAVCIKPDGAERDTVCRMPAPQQHE